VKGSFAAMARNVSALTTRNAADCEPAMVASLSPR
jgi:hypothetical protein